MEAGAGGASFNLLVLNTKISLSLILNLTPPSPGRMHPSVSVIAAKLSTGFCSFWRLSGGKLPSIWPSQRRRDAASHVVGLFEVCLFCSPLLEGVELTICGKCVYFEACDLTDVFSIRVQHDWSGLMAHLPLSLPCTPAGCILLMYYTVPEGL